MMAQCTAYGKLNLALKVTGRDARGYHLLDSVMVTVRTADCIDVRVAQGAQHRLLRPAWLAAQPDNTLCRAAALFAPYGVPALEIAVDKHIPVGAGMGGGSADAAALLRWLRSQYAPQLSEEALLQMGLQIGADVPFALCGGMARARGVGEQLTPLPPPQGLYAVWAMGEAALSTPQVYRTYDVCGSSLQVDIPAFVQALYAHDFPNMCRYGGNDLQQAAVQLCPSIACLQQQMQHAGAGYACMTGSGAAVFGLFATQAEALRAVETLRAQGYRAELA